MISEGILVEYKDKRTNNLVLAITMHTIDDGRIRCLSVLDTLSLQKEEDLRKASSSEEIYKYLTKAKEIQKYLFSMNEVPFENSGVEGWSREKDKELQLEVYDLCNKAYKLAYNTEEDIFLSSFKIFNLTLDGLDPYFKEHDFQLAGILPELNPLDASVFGLSWENISEIKDVPEEYVSKDTYPEDTEEYREYLNKHMVQLTGCHLPREGFIFNTEESETFIVTKYILRIDNPTYNKVKTVLDSALD